MVLQNTMIFSSIADRKRIADHWVRKVGYMTKQALEYRTRDGNDGKFIDIDYHNLIRDSISELEKIYRFNGGFPTGLSERFAAHEAEHPHRKHGTHHYSMEDFNLTGEEIDRHTAHYVSFMKEHYGNQQTEKI